MATPPKCECPDRGAWFVRNDPHRGRYEAQVVWRNIRHDGSWSVMLITDEVLTHRVDSDRFHQSIQHDDWRPVDWVWSDEACMFAPRDLEYDDEKREWNKVDVPEPGPEDLFPSIGKLPEANPGEHPASWKRRVKVMYPSLNSTEGAAYLKDAWPEVKKRKAG
ncbi:MAG: hypothetical protein P1V36_00195 [Planctomycetota bacterium]|nr:hypothetical protein [Planctomycetota bacterium]